MKRIMIIAGEASGDLHAAKLASCLRKNDPSLELFGIGGQEMQKSGVEILVDAANLAVVGLFEVLAHRKVIFAALNKMREILNSNPPDLIILVDYAEFNLKLAESAKQAGVKVLFYISPQVWAWRQGRVKKIRQVVDMMAVVFPFEEEFYRKHNVPVRFVGHPLSGEVFASTDRDTFLNNNSLSSNNLTIGLFPGSRKSEIKRLLPVILESATRLRKKYPQIQFILPVASTLKADDFSNYLSAYNDLNIKLLQNNRYDVMHACNSIITVSGTVTLEIALIGTPMVIINRLSWLSYHIVRRLIKIPFIGLCNIIANKKIAPELIQSDATAIKIEAEVVRTLEDKEYREKMIKNLSEMNSLLSSKTNQTDICQLALEML